jgi:hypothetical protein
MAQALQPTAKQKEGRPQPHFPGKNTRFEPEPEPRGHSLVIFKDKAEPFEPKHRLYTKHAIANGRNCPISSVDQRGSRNKVDKDKRDACKQRTGIGGVLLAFLTGAGVATTAILIASKALSPNADKLIKKCNRAFDALDDELMHKLAV